MAEAGSKLDFRKKVKNAPGKLSRMPHQEMMRSQWLNADGEVSEE